MKTQTILYLGAILIIALAVYYQSKFSSKYLNTIGISKLTTETVGGKYQASFVAVFQEGSFNKSFYRVRGALETDRYITEPELREILGSTEERLFVRGTEYLKAIDGNFVYHYNFQGSAIDIIYSNAVE